MAGKNNKEKKNKPTDLMRRQTDLQMMENRSPFFGITPFATMRRFMEDMDRMFEEFGGLRTTPFFQNQLGFPQLTEFEKGMWSPQIEVLRNEGELMVRADLPGMKLEDINLEIADGELNLSGERKEESEEKKEGFYRSERSYGSFYRSIPLPEGVNAENATAKFENGVLEVKIAIPVSQSTNKIEIKAGSPEPPPKAVAAST